MVSLTFDEFHAIRNRQRATAEAEASAVTEKASRNHAPGNSLASERPVGSNKAAEALSSSSSKLPESSSSASPPPAESRGRSNGASDGEVAPTSGSVSA